MKEVIIKVYVEEAAGVSSSQQERKTAMKRSIPSQRTRPRGFDRRAELLAYIHKLRHGDPSPSKTSTEKYNKKWKWSSLSFPKIRLSFPPRSNRQWRYETIDTEDYNHVHGSCCGKNSKRKFRFCEKLKSFIKELSCTGCRCI